MSATAAPKPNTALSLAYQGDKAAYVSVVPANRLGECALRSLKAYGVNTTRVVRQGDRLGCYVFEVGASQRGNGCVYDRKFSAINMAKRDVFDWDEILKGIDVFYFSGVTPAVSDEMARPPARRHSPPAAPRASPPCAT